MVASTTRRPVQNCPACKNRDRPDPLFRLPFPLFRRPHNPLPTKQFQSHPRSARSWHGIYIV